MSDDKVRNPLNRWLLGAVSSAALAGAMLWEGAAATPYYDIAGVLTVCNGYTGDDIVPGRIYTPLECSKYLHRELGAHGAGVLKCAALPLSQGEYDAYSLFAYNVGVGGFCGSTLLKRLNAGDRRGACDGLLAWNKARVKGSLVEIRGLTNRRTFERSMCLKGLP